LPHRSRIVVTLGDVEGALIRCKQDAVRTGGVERDALDVPLPFPGSGWRDVVDGVVRKFAIAVVGAVTRVGEPDAALGVKGKIVRTVQALPFKAVNERGPAASRVVAGDRPSCLFAGIEPSLRVEDEAVGATAVVIDRRDGPCCRVIAADLVVG